MSRPKPPVDVLRIRACDHYTCKQEFAKKCRVYGPKSECGCCRLKALKNLAELGWEDRTAGLRGQDGPYTPIYENAKSAIGKWPCPECPSYAKCLTVSVSTTS